MSELRRDPITGFWVVIAPDRKPFLVSRPETTVRVLESRLCPFCPGNENKTPPELMACREDGSAPNTPGWKVRAFPNKFPALHVEGGLNREGWGMFDRINGIGAHEIVVETPAHNTPLRDLEQEQIERLLSVYRYRIQELYKDFRLRYVLVFKNHGKLAGSTMAHSHSQLIATPIVPKHIEMELTGALLHYNEKERCIWCDMLSQEREAGARVVLEDRHFVVLTPYASRSPFEVWLLPKRHSCQFTSITAEEQAALAFNLKTILSKIAKGLQYPSIFIPGPGTGTLFAMISTGIWKLSPD